MSNVPVIPRNVVAAIEELKGTRSSIGIVRMVDRGSDTNSAKTIRSWCEKGHADGDYHRYDTLLTALVNGYEIEKTAEELAEEQRQTAHHKIAEQYVCKRQRHAELRLSSLSHTAASALGYADGIKYTLNELDIKISGVNA